MVVAIHPRFVWMSNMFHDVPYLLSRMIDQMDRSTTYTKRHVLKHKIEKWETMKEGKSRHPCQPYILASWLASIGFLNQWCHLLPIVIIKSYWTIFFQLDSSLSEEVQAPTALGMVHPLGMVRPLKPWAVNHTSRVVVEECTCLNKIFVQMDFFPKQELLP